MSYVSLPVCLASLVLTILSASAQTTINNASHSPGTSDNTGSADQSGTEVLHSSPGAGVRFETDGSFEHIGQFYVAADGLWNRNLVQTKSTIGTDYFGYAPTGFGSGQPYQGKGIMGASAANGGSGAGQPTFGTIQLNSTGVFPLAAGMYVANSLTFNGHGPGLSSIITTPNCSTPETATNTVVFGPTASVRGPNKANYIDGFASVSGVISPFTLPLGDPTDGESPYHPLLINSLPSGMVTARYRHTVSHVHGTRAEGIEWISPIGSWWISAPVGTNVTAYTPTVDYKGQTDMTLHLVGWTGKQWVDLSQTAASAAAPGGGWTITGSLVEGVMDLAIGFIRQTELVEDVELKLWPNPTRGMLNVNLATNQPISAIQVLDLKGRRLLQTGTAASVINTSTLSSGSYLLEVQTSEGRNLRRRFIKQ